MSDLGRVILMILHVSDLERSVQFYRDLLEIPLQPGLNDPQDDPWFGGQHAEISWRDGAYLHFALFPARPPHGATSGAELGLLVADAAQLHDRIAARVEVLHAPRPEPWGLTARYLDPDGNIVGITSR